MVEATPQHLLDCATLVYDDLLKRPDFVLQVMKANDFVDLIYIGRIRQKKRVTTNFKGEKCWFQIGICRREKNLYARELELYASLAKRSILILRYNKVGFRVERRHHLQSVCLQDVVLVDQTDEKSGWSLLQRPPYSPDLAPRRHFICLGPLEQHLGGKHFADDDDVQHEILLWMRQQPKEFYAAGIRALIKRWDNIGGEYVEK
ncbi:hypothetical protein AVEN_205920-1 [Araneus ventricosus]|uniref:Histone-lysine N-methyltransferase SETMAR n=1 Tax=Araneus ventricosus TaxID=182803 RepID=A0A4Y2HHI7_ARAVE|nr:hypothetical protein AVEN_205920-1 [Araneus ventricosus]